MKKLALIICVLMLFSVVACANNNGNVDTGNDGAIDDVKNGTEGNVTDNVDDDIDEMVNDIADEKGDTRTLTGTAQGYGGEVKVTVEVDGKDIVSVQAVGDNETEGVGSKAIEQLPAKIEEADSTDVEGISGATVTSNAIKEAANKALEGMK